MTLTDEDAWFDTAWYGERQKVENARWCAATFRRHVFPKCLPLGMAFTLLIGLVEDARGASQIHPANDIGHVRSDLQRTVWWRTGLDRGIDPYLLYAVALVESARVSGSSAAPWPWALHHSGRTFYPGNPQAAIDQVRGAWSAGKRTIDVGLMQVNLRWHRHRVRRPEDLVDPQTNLQVGADILAEAIGSSPGDLALGVGRYHAWQDRAAAYRYGRKVLALADRIRNARIQ